MKCMAAASTRRARLSARGRAGAPEISRVAGAGRLHYRAVRRRDATRSQFVVGTISMRWSCYHLSKLPAIIEQGMPRSSCGRAAAPADARRRAGHLFHRRKITYALWGSVRDHHTNRARPRQRIGTRRGGI